MDHRAADMLDGRSLDFEAPELDLGGESNVDANEELIQYALSSDKPQLNELGNELIAIQQKLEEKEEAYKSQVLHTETITMMAKYQLVYIKMENFWKRLERLTKQRSFAFKLHFMDNLRFSSAGIRQRTTAAAVKLENGIDVMSCAIRRVKAKRLAIAFAAIKIVDSVTRGSVGQLQTEVKEYWAKIGEKERAIKVLRKEIGGGGGPTGLLKKKKSADRVKIKRKELSDDPKTLKENQKILQERNSAIESKIKATENQIFKFINDLSSQITLLHIESSRPGYTSNEHSLQKPKKATKMASYL